jgi:hypothetical protein
MDRSWSLSPIRCFGCFASLFVLTEGVTSMNSTFPLSQKRPEDSASTCLNHPPRLNLTNGVVAVNRPVESGKGISAENSHGHRGRNWHTLQ